MAATIPLPGAGPTGFGVSATRHARRPDGASVLDAPAAWSSHPGPGGSDGLHYPPSYDKLDLYLVRRLGPAPFWCGADARPAQKSAKIAKPRSAQRR